jgi:fused signal recognition particle receptor
VSSLDPTLLLELIAGGGAVVVLAVVLLLLRRRRRRRAAGATLEGAEPSAAPLDAAGYRNRFIAALAKSRTSIAQRLGAVIGGTKRNDELLEEIERVLIESDLGPRAADRLLGTVRGMPASERTAEGVRIALAAEVQKLLGAPAPEPGDLPSRPWVVLVVGVNGVGKTTTIGKLAARHRARGRSVLVVAGDTFRAAAIDQLGVWAERTGAQIVRQEPGTDPSAVVFDGMKAALARQVDVVLIDTAGRLHTKVNLMEELRKVRRVIERAQPGAPQETLLVLDATTGQNAVSQARTFGEAVGVTGVVLTKLDGSARGGVVVAIAQELGVPVRYVGVGEREDDLQDFDPELFSEALFAAD